MDLIDIQRQPKSLPLSDDLRHPYQFPDMTIYNSEPNDRLFVVYGLGDHAM